MHMRERHGEGCSVSREAVLQPISVCCTQEAERICKRTRS